MENKNINMEVVDCTNVMEVAIPRYVNTEDLLETKTELFETEETVVCESLLDLCGDLEEIDDESIREKADILKQEVDKVEVDSITCYVGDRVEYLIDDFNCHITHIKLFNVKLITNLNMTIKELIIDHSMETMYDMVIAFTIDDIPCSRTLKELLDLGLAFWVGDIEESIEMSGIGFRGLTTLCKISEVEY